jgi:hypothetical protein
VLASLPTGSDAPIFSIAVPSGSFYVRFHATRGAEKSAASNEIRIHVGVPVAPSPPDLFSTATPGSGLVLSWRNTFDGGAPTGLTLDVTGSATAQLPLGVTESFSASSAPPGTYTFRLRAHNAGGASAFSNAATVTIPSPCAGPPEAPTSMLAYRIGTTAFVVWEPPASGPAVSSYVLNVTGSFTGSIPTTRRSLSGEAGTGSYTMGIVAVNPCGSSPSTPTQTIVVP